MASGGRTEEQCCRYRCRDVDVQPTGLSSVPKVRMHAVIHLSRLHALYSRFLYTYSYVMILQPLLTARASATFACIGVELNE